MIFLADEGEDEPILDLLVIFRLVGKRFIQTH